MSVLTSAKRFFLGKPIATKHAHHQRLSKVFALPVFASDALSSVAYATEATMGILLLSGTRYLSITFGISIAIALLIIIVASSYYQTLHAYPHGGGSYTVASANLGSLAGRIAGASLLIDYVLTVSVSVTAGVLALVSIFPGLQPHLVPVNLLFVAIIAIINLRGTKESGIAFAIPTYSFIILILGMIVVGLIRMPLMHVTPMADPNPHKELEAFGLFLLLKAFASGCTAMTGIEAISNGIQAFKAPESRNASITLSWMAAVLAAMFLGTSWLATKLHVIPYLNPDDKGYQTVLALVCREIFGAKSIYLYLLQIFTALILIIAANTAFADFPRLSSMIARDGFLPRQLTSVGDRLVFQNGIIVLTVLSTSLIIFFKGKTDALIPLYAIGVFTAFTLSQFGMVVHQIRKKKYSAMIVSLIGGIATTVVTGVIVATKFSEGGWIVLIALAAFLTLFWAIHKHYTYLANELSITPDDTLQTMSNTVLLVVPWINRGIVQAISYANSITSDVRAIHVATDPSRAQAIQDEWGSCGADMPLVLLESPGRSVLKALTDYVDEQLAAKPGAFITVIIPEDAAKKGFEGLKDNNVAMQLRMAMRSRKNVVVTSDLSIDPVDCSQNVKNTVLLLVPRLHRGILQAISYANTMTEDVRALHVTMDPASAQNIKQDWMKFGADLPLVILESPFRSLLTPVTEYIDEALSEDRSAYITVIVPEAVPKHWWQGLLHNNAAIPLKLALRSRKNVVITNVRYYLK
jgi:amino acid transporter